MSAAREPRLIAVHSHARPHETAGALRELGAIAAAHGAVLLLDEEEARKHAHRRR